MYCELLVLTTHTHMTCPIVHASLVWNTMPYCNYIMSKENRCASHAYLGSDDHCTLSRYAWLVFIAGCCNFIKLLFLSSCLDIIICYLHALTLEESFTLLCVWVCVSVCCVCACNSRALWSLGVDTVTFSNQRLPLYHTSASHLTFLTELY